MNLSEAKEKALSLILEYSNDGVLIPESENADYLLLMNRFASDAQIQISNNIGINTSFTLEIIPTNENGIAKYSLPDDFKRLISITLNDVNFYQYQVRNGQLWIDKRYHGLLEIFYEKNPTLLTPETPDDYEFEVDKHVEYLIPYYIGGLAMAEEKEDISNKLLNIFYDGLNNIQDFKNNTFQTIQSVDNW